VKETDQHDVLGGKNLPQKNPLSQHPHLFLNSISLLIDMLAKKHTAVQNQAIISFSV